LNLSGDVCINCRHEFVRSFCAFETLPLVQFELEDGISDEQALKYLDMDPSETTKFGGVGLGGRKGQDDVQTDINVMSLEGGGGGDDGGAGEDGVHPDDDFHTQLHHFEADSEGNFPPIRVGAKALVAMKREEVFVRRWTTHTKALRATYYRSVIPDLPIVLCQHCNHFFFEEDYEFFVLQRQPGGRPAGCPFCRTPVVLEPATHAIDEQPDEGVGSVAQPVKK